jgi:hypothetical protein
MFKDLGIQENLHLADHLKNFRLKPLYYQVEGCLYFVLMNFEFVREKYSFCSELKNKDASQTDITE